MSCFEDIRIHVLLLVLAALPTALRAQGPAPPDELLLHWSFDGNGDTIEDSSGRGHTAPLGDGIRVQDPERGTILRLNAGHGNVTTSLDDFDATKPFSVAFWLKPQTLSSYSQQVGSTLGEFLFRVNGSGYMVGGISSADVFTQQDLSEVIEVDKWQHVAFTYYDGYARYYKDGHLVGAKTSAGPQPWSTFFLKKINGDIDDVRVYNRRLHTSEIVAIATPGVTLETPHYLAEERYTTELLWQYQVPPGVSSPEIPPHHPGWNVLSDFGTVTAFGGSYYVVYLDGLDRPNLVKLTRGASGSIIASAPHVIDENWKVRADSHHHLALEVDKGGQLHLVGDMHNYPRYAESMDHLPAALQNQKILYWRTSVAGDIESIEFQGGGTSAPKGTGFTYLRFFKDNEQNLYMAGRYDMLPPSTGFEDRNRKGVGMTRYDDQTQTWVTIGALPDPSALAEVVLWERYDVSSSSSLGYTKVIPWLAFDHQNTLHLSASLTGDDGGVDYSQVAKNNNSPDTIDHYTTDIVYMRSTDRGQTFTTSGNQVITLPGRLEPGPQQAEILFTADLVHHVTSVTSSVAIDYLNQPVVAFHRQRLDNFEPNSATYLWRQGGIWKEYRALGPGNELDGDFRYVLEGPDGDFTLVLSANVDYFYRLWEPHGELRKVRLPFRPYYFNPNHFKATGELLGLTYDNGTVSVYLVTIERDDV